MSTACTPSSDFAPQGDCHFQLEEGPLQSLLPRANATTTSLAKVPFKVKINVVMPPAKENGEKNEEEGEEGEEPFSSPDGDPYDFIMSTGFGSQDLAGDDFRFEDPGAPTSSRSFAGRFESDESPLSSNHDGFNDSASNPVASFPPQLIPRAANPAPPVQGQQPPAFPTPLLQSPSMLQSPSLQSPPLQSPSLQTFFPQAAHIQVFCPGVQPELHFLSPHLPPKQSFSPSSSLSPTTPTTTTTPTTERRKYSTYAIKTSSLEKLQPNLASLNLTRKEQAKVTSQEGSTDPGSSSSGCKTPLSGEVKSEVQKQATPSAESEFGSSTDADNHEFYGGSDDEDYDGESTMGDEEYDEDGNYVPPLPPSTRIIERKPKRGGPHRRDILRREELLPPPSPRTQSDPALMQVYRQERNRLAAKRSRERKKDYIKQLEGTCKALKLHNEELSRELLKVRKEQSELKSKPKKARKSSLP